MEMITDTVSIVFGLMLLCGVLFLVFKVISILLKGAADLFDEASEYSFVGIILFFVSWIFLTPLMVIWSLFRGWDKTQSTRRLSAAASENKLSFLNDGISRFLEKRGDLLPQNEDDQSLGLLPEGESFQLPGSGWRLWMPENSRELGLKSATIPPNIEALIKQTPVVHYFCYSDRTKGSSSFLQITKAFHADATFESSNLNELRPHLSAATAMNIQQSGPVVINDLDYIQHPVWGRSLPPILKSDVSKGLNTNKYRMITHHLFADNGFTYMLSFNCNRDRDLSILEEGLHELLRSFKLPGWKTKRPFFELRDPPW